MDKDSASTAAQLDAPEPAARRSSRIKERKRSRESCDCESTQPKMPPPPNKKSAQHSTSSKHSQKSLQNHHTAPKCVGNNPCGSSQEDYLQLTPPDLLRGTQSVSPTKPAFSPVKLASPLKAVAGSSILDGGADYSKPFVPSQANSSKPSTQASKPWPTSQASKPWATSPNKPWATSQASKPWATSPNKPWATSQANKPWANSQTSKPWATSQANKPWATSQANKPWANSQANKPSTAQQTPCDASSATRELFEKDPFDDDMDALMLSQDLDLDPNFTGSSAPKTSVPGSSVSAAGSSSSTSPSLSQLPLEVLENIFCRIPILDLCLHVTRVCSSWNQIISDPGFLPWKKRYFRVLRGSKEHREAVEKEMAESGINLSADVKPTHTSPDILPTLITCMRDFKPETSPNMTECLRRHPKYSWVEALVRERLPEGSADGTPRPWSSVTALVILSDSVSDISALLRCLLAPPSQCTGPEVLECLYKVATYLLLLRYTKYMEAWTTLHYRLYYALYLYENASVTVTEAPQAGPRAPLHPPSSLSYTQEQLRVCNHNSRPGEILKIVAFAGTGKTTTLIRYTELRPRTKFLLLVFNKSVREDCCGRFPRNVECLTSHSLAYRSGVMARYPRRKLGGNIRVYEIAMQLPHRGGENLYQQAKLVLDTVCAYQSSADEAISHAHAPFYAKNRKGGQEYLGETRRANIVKDANRIWTAMVDPDNRLQMTHDTYLKMYQLSKPRITNYDVILIDEAQDQTPAVIDILLRQPQAKILVGDPNQQIYSFRGAVNAMERIPASTTFYLTQSFRFGSSIAQLANSCLEVFKGTSNKLLVGNATQGHLDGRTEGQLAILTRSNFTLFQEAVRKCSYAEGEVKVAFSGGAGAFGFDFIRDLYYLMIGDHSKIENRFVARYTSLEKLESYADSTMDLELAGKIKIVKTYQHHTLEHIDRILEKCVGCLQDADVVFSTAHKAKGLEFSTVRVTDDFATNFMPHFTVQRGMSDLVVDGNAQTVGGDELNLLYVAVTRARLAVHLTPTLMRVLHFAGEKFRAPRLSADLTPPLTCVLTNESFSPDHVLTLSRKHVKLGSAEDLPAGHYSPAHLHTTVTSLAGLYGPQDPPPPSNGPTPRERDWAPQPLHRGIVSVVMDMMGFGDSDDDDW